MPYLDAIDLQEVAVKRDELKKLLLQVEAEDPLLAYELKEKINNYNGILLEIIDKYEMEGDE